MPSDGDEAQSRDALDGVAARLDAQDLPFFGVRRRADREHDSRYYVVQATAEELHARMTNLLVKLTTLDGAPIWATVPRFPSSCYKRRCSVILVTHPAPEGGHLWHRHILRIDPIGGE